MEKIEDNIRIIVFENLDKILENSDKNNCLDIVEQEMFESVVKKAFLDDKYKDFFIEKFNDYTKVAETKSIFDQAISKAIKKYCYEKNISIRIKLF